MSSKRNWTIAKTRMSYLCSPLCMPIKRCLRNAIKLLMYWTRDHCYIWERYRRIIGPLPVRFRINEFLVVPKEGGPGSALQFSDRLHFYNNFYLLHLTFIQQQQRIEIQGLTSLLLSFTFASVFVSWLMHVQNWTVNYMENELFSIK